LPGPLFEFDGPATAKEEPMHLAYSLRFRLMVLYLTIFLVLATLMMTAMPFYYQNSLSSQTRTLTEGTLTSIARNIETYLDDLNRLTVTPYLNTDVMHALQAKASPTYVNTDDYTKLLTERALKTTLPLFLQNSRTDILATVVVSPDGSAYIYSIGSELSGPVANYSYTLQDWYRKAVAADGNVVFISSHPQDYLSTTAPRQVFSVARMIKDPDTFQPLGVIMADADTKVLAKIVSDINFNVSSIVCIFDNQNKLLYSSKPVSADLQRQAAGTGTTVRSGGNSYSSVSKLITPAGWNVVVLLSTAEIAAKTRWLYAMGIIFAVAGLLLTFLLFFILSRWIVRPFDEMIGVMKQVETGNLQTRFFARGNDEIARLGRALNNMIERLNRLIEREYKAVISQRNAEYRALQSQIQPHFLYNTLNGFIGLNRLGNTAGLEKAIFALSGMLHYTLEGDELVELGDEIKFIQKYCNLQQIRFRDRLEVDIDCDPAVEAVKVPRLLLQPLVENAFIHGIEPAERRCKLTVSAKLGQKNGSPCARIAVADDGRGFDPQSLEGKAGLGFANVRERLSLAFRDSTISVSSQVNVGTQIVIEIPVKA
jgi:two-component system sensor histidine kinase YesM